MRDIPVFTTENGVASLVLREVPYRAEAYITLQDSQNPEGLLKECVDFCRAVGADRVYAKGNAILEGYPMHTAIWKMQRRKDGLPSSDAALFPVTEETIDRWRSLYNEGMKAVPNAATMTREDGRKLIARGAGYFVHRSGELLGIGIAAGDTVEAIISVKRGHGADVMLALCSVLFSENIHVEVASVNSPAFKLYEKLGFTRTVELSRWYSVK